MIKATDDSGIVYHIDPFALPFKGLFLISGFVSAYEKAPKNTKKRRSFFRGLQSPDGIRLIIQYALEQSFSQRKELFEEVRDKDGKVNSDRVSQYANQIYQLHYMRGHFVLGTEGEDDLKDEYIDFSANECLRLLSKDFEGVNVGVEKYSEFEYAIEKHIDFLLSEIKNICTRAPKGMSICHFLYSLLANCQSMAIDYVLDKSVGNSVIQKQLDFKPEEKRAAITILSYFQDVLEAKYPESDVSVSIQQQNDNITLFVRSNDKNVEQISASLQDYMDVVTGKADYHTLFTEEGEILRLQNNLNIAKAQLENERLMRQFVERRVESLERIAERFSDQLFKITDRVAEQNRDVIDVLNGVLSRSEKEDQNLQTLMQLIEEDMKNPSPQRKTRISSVLDKIRVSNPQAYEKIKRVSEGAAGSVIATYFLSLF